MIQSDLNSLAPEVRKPLNRRVDETTEFYHTTNPTFSQIPVPEFNSYDKIVVLAQTGIFGVPRVNWPTYVSVDESMSLSHYSQHGKQLDRVYEAVVDGQKLSKVRNIFIDPEIISPTEFALNYIIGDGIPRAALKEIRELQRLDAIIKGER